MIGLASRLFPAIMLVLSLHVAPAQAQLSRTAVSAARGSDANNCDVATPCRTFQVAHNKTTSDGEIIVLDPGGYGGLTITKSVSIVNDGVGEASILVSGGATGIVVNAPPAAGYVNLRGLTIQGIGFGGGTGLRFNSGFSLTMTNCVVRNHTGNGIDFVPGASSRLAVSNTLVADNGGSGIKVAPAGGALVKAIFNRVEAYNNSSDGISLFSPPLGTGGWTYATVEDTVAANNGGAGFSATSGTSFPGVGVIVARSVTANNNIGASVVGGKAEIVLGQSTVAANTVTWSGFVRSFGDNNIHTNLDLDPAPTTIAKK